MPQSKISIQRISSRNKSIARKIAKLLDYSCSINLSGTGSVYLSIRFTYSKKISSKKQIVLRISNHECNYHNSEEIDMIYSCKESEDEFVAMCISIIEKRIAKYRERKKQWLED